MSLKPFDLLSLTWRALYTNPLRSTLTTLGVFMGVTAVTATLQVGSISRAIIAQQLAEREAPQVSLFPQRGPDPHQRVRLTQAELDFLQERLVGLESMSAISWVNSDAAIFQDQEAYPTMFAVTQQYLHTTGRVLSQGRFFSSTDYDNFRPVVVIDQQLASQLFEAQSPIGRRIYIKQQPFVVVGVLTAEPSEDGPTDGQLLLTTAMAQALWGQQQLGMFSLRPQTLEQLEELGTQSEQLLTQRFPGQKFWVWNNVEDILEQQATLRLASRALTAVGAISLLVGGVGIA
ncbi:MAG: ABC transporter permease, partial [Elainellaceae cyanobacterium]